MSSSPERVPLPHGVEPGGPGRVVGVVDVERAQPRLRLVVHVGEGVVASIACNAMEKVQKNRSNNRTAFRVKCCKISRQYLTTTTRDLSDSSARIMKSSKYVSACHALHLQACLQPSILITYESHFETGIWWQETLEVIND